MDSFVMHLLHAAAWAFGIIFLLALIGLIAIVRWVMGMFRRGESAVEGGINRVEGTFRR